MRIAAAFALLAAIQSPAQAAPPCLSAPEAESLALIALPDILRETGRVCATRLSATSPIRRADGPFIARYQAAADAAWPAAQLAIAKLSDPAVSLLLQSDYARPVLTTLVVPLIVGRIAVRDCATIDRMVTLLAPLPPRNAAGVVVTTLQYLRAEKSRGDAVAVPNLPLCALPR